MKAILKNSLKDLLNRLNPKMVSFVLVFSIVVTSLPIAITNVLAAETTYPKPNPIAPIDNTKQDKGITAWEWYYGIHVEPSNDGTETRSISERYSSYVSGFEETIDLTQKKLPAKYLGDENHPYIIYNGLELAYMTTLIDQGVDFNGEYIRIEGSLSGKAETEGLGKCIDLSSSGGLLYQETDSKIGFMPCDDSGNIIGWKPIGTQDHPFQGYIYADEGVKIYNLSYNIPSNFDGTKGDYSSKLLDSNYSFGLFGYVGESATIKNLHLEDVQIYNSQTKSSQVMGGLIAYGIKKSVDSSTTIENCSIKGI